MAMVTPVGVNIGAFDATKDEVFSFYSVGGNRVVANRINIYNNESGELVYTDKVTTYSFTHTVPANTLTNGEVYNFTFNTYDVDDNESLPSSPILFHCYTTPTFEFTNISNNQQIDTSSYEFRLHYNQVEGELVYFVAFYLYDDNNNLIKQSDDIYSTSTVTDVTFNYLITGLTDDSNYYIKAKGYTRNNAYLETDDIHFSVKYNYPSVFANLEVTNVCDKGYNKIVSNVSKLSGHTSPKLPTYIDNEKLSLLDITNTQEVIWEDDDIVGGDFGMRVWFEVGLEGKYFKLTNAEDENTYMIGKLVREIPYGQVQPFDYVEIAGYINGTEKFYMRSNYVPLVNNTSYLILNFKYAPSVNTYELVLHVYNQEDNFINWRHFKEVANYIITSDGDYIVDDQGRILSDVYGYEIADNFDELPLVTTIDLDNIVTDGGDNIATRILKRSTNVVYNRLTNLQYRDNLNIVGLNRQNKYDMGNAIFPIGKIELFNGIYDHIEFYKDYNRPYSTDHTAWSYNTYMLCNFNDNINSSSLDFVLENISNIKIKAREVGQFDYITLYDIPVQSESDLSFTVYDYRVPNGHSIEYSMVLIQNGGIEGQYISTLLDTKWSKLFISDDTMTLSLIGNVSYGNINKHVPTGVLQPIGNKYPVVIRNSNINYYSGSVIGTILCDDYSKINRGEFVKLRETWCDFLTNGKAKVIKDWNGNIFVAQVSNEPTVTLNQALGSGIGNIAFDFVEQGKWDNQEDLYYNGIVKTL